MDSTNKAVIAHFSSYVTEQLSLAYKLYSDKEMTETFTLYDTINYPNWNLLASSDTYTITSSGTYVSWTNLKAIPLGDYYVKMERGTTNTGLLAVDSFNFIRNKGLLIFRTNIENGSFSFDHYASGIGGSDWIYYDGNSQVDPGHATGGNFWMDQPYQYVFDHILTNVSPDTGGNGNFKTNTLLFTLEDGTRLYMNRTEQKLYVWAPWTDSDTVYLKPDGTPYLATRVAVFTYYGTSSSTMGSASYGYNPDPAYRGGELYLSDPCDIDTDDDGLLDGFESGGNHPSSWMEDWDWKKNPANPYDIDIDPDGLAGVRDPDSDNDGVMDGQELNPTYDFVKDYFKSLDDDANSLGKSYVENIIDPDSDGDGVWDGNETTLKCMLDVDSDDDGLVDGYLPDWYWDPHPEETVPHFTPYNSEYGTATGGFDPWEGEDRNLNGTLDSNEPAPNRADTDRDGLADGYDIEFLKTSNEFINLSRERIPFVDLGGGKVRFWGELTGNHNAAQSGATNQTNPDTDADSISDYKEIVGYQYKYIDKDGAEQAKWTYSDPLKVDTDADSIPDRDEYQHTDANGADSDGDGLSDVKEDKDKNRKRSFDETDPLDADTDNDGMLDGNLGASWNGTYPAEDLNNDGIVQWNESNPMKADSDGDGVGDKQEYLYTLANSGTGCGYVDSDGDGLINIKDPDSDNDGLPDGKENWNHDGVKDAGESNALNPDSDGDRLYDGAEAAPFTDADTDGISNVLDWDSNGDFIDDYGQTFTVFRTDAVDIDGDGKNNYTANTWISVDPDGANLTVSNASLVLNPYKYDSSGLVSPSYSTMMIRYGFTASGDPIQVMTPDGYRVLVNSTNPNIIYIELSTSSYTKYIYDANCGANTNKYSVTSPINYVVNHRETYDYRQALGTDSDFDGLNNVNETALGTDPNDRDTDNDGIIDGTEVSMKMNPLDPDSDNDGITDGTELGVTVPIAAMGNIGGTSTTATFTGSSRLNFTADADPSRTTNPLVADSDGDGLLDGWNDANGNGVIDTGETAGEDLNYDGAIAGDTNKNNRWDTGELWTETSATDRDSDDDGLEDGYEKNTLLTNPLFWESDGDGLFDSVEVGLTAPKSSDTDVSTGHFIPDADPKWTTDPTKQDSDNDGLNDGVEDKDHDGAFDNGTDETNATDPDTDHDGINDGTEVNGFYMPIMGQSKLVFTDPLTNDTDGDGIIDGTERDGYTIGIAGTPYYWSGVQTDPSNIDTDGDGLNDGQEARGWEISIFYERSMEVKENRTIYSKPTMIDTDSDGINDLYEFQNGADPNCVDTDGDLLLDNEEIYAENGTQRSNPCGIEGTPPKLSKLNTGYVPIISTWNGITYCSGWKLQVSVYAEDTAGLATVTFALKGFFGTKSQTYRFSAGTKSGVATVKFDIDWASTVSSGYDLNVTAADANGNMGYKVMHIKSITEIIVNLFVGALKTLAKIIIEAASTFINIIIEKLRKLVSGISDWIASQFNAIVQSFAKQIMQYIGSRISPEKINESAQVTVDKPFAGVIKNFLLIFGAVIITIVIVETFIKVVSAGTAAITWKVVLETFKSNFKNCLIDSLVGGLIVGISMAAFDTANDATLNAFIGDTLGSVCAPIVGILAFYLAVIVALTKVNPTKAMPKGISDVVEDIVGFGLLLFGLFLVLLNVNIPWVDIYLDIVGIALDVFGLKMIKAARGEDVSDTLGVLNFLSYLIFAIDIGAIMFKKYELP